MELDDTTQDNTQVMKIMSDFNSFLRRQSSTLTSLPEKNLLPEADSNSMPQRRTCDDNLSFSIDVKLKLNKMEKQYNSEKQSLVKSNVALEAECVRLNSQIQLLQGRCDKLEIKNKQLTDTNIEMVDKVKDAEEFRDEQVAKWKTSFESLEKMKVESDERLFSELSNYDTTNGNLMEQNMMLQTEVNNLTLRLEEALSIADLYNKKITDSTILAQRHQQTLSELAAAKLQVHTLKSRLNDVEDIEKNVKCFKEDMDRLRFVEGEYKSLLEENSMLKEKEENTALLKEKLISMEQKFSRAQEKCKKVDEMEVVNESLRRQLNDLSANSQAESALKLSQCEVSSLQNHLKLLSERNRVLQNDYETLQKKNREERQNEAVLNAKIEQQTESCSLLTAQLQRLKKRTALLSHERDSLRAILQSYDSELTMTSHTTQLNKRLTNTEEANKKLHSRIENLEAELQKNAEELMRQRLLSKHVAILPDKIKEEKTDFHPSTNEVVQNELTSVPKTTSDLRKENEELLEKIEVLEAALEQNRMRGGYDPRTEKVMHFSLNPSDSARQQFKQDFSRLKEENLKLKKKIMELEQGRDVSISEIEVPQSVREELAKSELRNKRLREVFSKKIQEFRQACYSLTGYRIDSSSESKFKLVSMYAESESDYLLFEMLPDGTMQLLETEFSKSLQDLISLHLHHQHSIPMFLSGVSVNLFSQQTMFTE